MKKNLNYSGFLLQNTGKHISLWLWHIFVVFEECRLSEKAEWEKFWKKSIINHQKGTIKTNSNPAKVVDRQPANETDSLQSDPEYLFARK